MAQLIPLPLNVSCFSKIQIGFTYTYFIWYQLTWVVPEKGPLNVCVCFLPTVDEHWVADQSDGSNSDRIGYTFSVYHSGIDHDKIPKLTFVIFFVVKIAKA